VFCGSINDFGGTVEEIEEEYLHFNKCHPLISYQLGFHAEYTTKRQILEDMAALGAKYKAPVYAHNSETANEVAGCVERYGMTPTAFLNSLGMFEYGGGGFHCVHMTQEDLDICKEKGLWVVTNPSSNIKLASGIAPIHKMLSMGIGLAIGTDGAASNNCLDMFREMFLVTGLQKVSLSDASAVDAMDVLRMATVGGAQAMGLFDCDVLAEGKRADVVLLDLQQPNMQPLNNIAKNVVYSGSKQNVKMTMIDGKILYEDGVFHVGIAPEEIYEKVNESITRMKE
jgi:5-methylthioadenosine/S-adenosylhomocysteine deaminase